MAVLVWELHKLSCDSLHMEEEKDEDSSDMLNWTAKVYVSRFHSRIYDLTLSNEQIICMSTFVPDELISLLLTCRRYKTFIGSVLFADVSGFTPLCEKYAKFGPTGAYRLTATLNQYIGSMVDLIYTFGGDVLKFSGDAFLAVWHVRVNEFMYDKIHDAISCALHIQYTLGNFVTDVGLHLRVKLAISAGNMVFSVTGKEKSATYVVYGLPILEVKKAESLCKSGDTVVAPSAWSSLSSRNYSYTELGGGYMKIKQILYDPKYEKRRIFEFDPNFIMQIYRRNRMLKMLSSKTDPSATILDFEKNFREIIFDKSLRKAAESLRPFVISPVMQQIEANQSLDYTVEMRQVTIMFINVIPNKTSCRDIVILVDETYRSILKSIQRRLGLINKVCLFDKDIMFLVIFGLKGYKDKDEAMRTLRAGYEILQNVSEFSGVKSISIGVTVGTTYCGVVGHPLRKEYTVIGAPVNKAARLGCTFKGLVTCDATVAFNSRLPPAFFEKMEPKCLKGLGTVSNIYTYRDLGVNALTVPPILGRFNTIKKFEDMLWEDSAYRAIVILGEPRIGKTRLILELSDTADEANWLPIVTSLNTKIGPTACLLHKMIASVLGNTVKERMTALKEIHSDEEDIEKLHRLNSCFDVMFPTPADLYLGETRKSSDMEIYRKTLRKMFDKHVILIDDADGLDPESWSILRELIKVPNVLVAMTLACTSEGMERNITEYIKQPLVMTTKLQNLPYKYIAPLVCQMLAVDAVPHRLIRALFKISRGNPGWVQAFLLSYVDTGTFVVQSEYLSKLSRRSFYIPDHSSKTKKPSLSLSLNEDLNFSEEKVHVCKLIKKDLANDGIPPTFDDVIMATFDNLTAFEQLLLKCGAILGKKFQRSELEAVMNYPSNLTLALAVKNLFEIDVLGCATKFDDLSRCEQCAQSPFGFKEPIKCNCPAIHKGRYLRLPTYSMCQFMTFKFEMLRKTIYQIIPINQITEFHLRAYNYLREQTIKCPECVNYEILLNIRQKNQMVSGMGGMSFATDKKKSFYHRSVKDSIDVRRRAVLGVSKQDTSDMDGQSPSTWNASSSAMVGFESHLNTSFTASLGFAKRKSANVSVEGLVLDLPHVIKCTCNQLCVTMYEKLLYHSSSAEAKVEKLKLLVEFGIHYVKYSNYVQAYNLLKAALELYEEIIRNLSYFEIIEDKRGFSVKKKKKRSVSVREILFEKEKALCYFGKCCTHLGNLKRACVELSEVANVSCVTHIEFLIKKGLLKMKTVPEKFKEQMRSYIGLKSFAYTCLAHAHVLQTEFAEAEDALKPAIRYANMVNKLKYMALAYSTYIDITLLRGHFESAKKAEKEALEKCIPLYRENNIWHVLYLGKILTAVFKGRLYRGELSRAVEVAKVALRAAYTFRAYYVFRFIYPLFIRCLAYQKKFFDVIEILLDLKTHYKDYSRFESQMTSNLYILLNFILLSEIGFCLEEPLTLIDIAIKQYATHSKPKYMSHHTHSRKIHIQMWLWYIRRKEFDLAQTWQVKPHDGMDFLNDNIPSTLLLLEGQLLSLVHEANTRNEINQAVAQIVEMRLRQLEVISKSQRHFLIPRTLHLKAYKNVICFNFDEFKRIIPGLMELKKALKLAIDHGNVHEAASIEKSLENWYVYSESLRVEKKYSEVMEVISLAEEQQYMRHHLEDKLFHLPLPYMVIDKLKECIATNLDILVTTGLFRAESTEQ